MAKCVGCGLAVNNGILEVKACTDGGIKCATAGSPAPNGCTDGLYVSFPPNVPGTASTIYGCGLKSDGTGRLAVDVCDKGGILCGATDDDAEDNCLFVNIQGQGTTACVALAAAQDKTCTGVSPNCNGLVRTCDGLWSPPKMGAATGKCSQNQQVPFPFTGTMTGYMTPLGSTKPDLPALYQNDAVFSDGNNIHDIQFWTVQQDPCLDMYGMTFSQFSFPGFFVHPDEVWRVSLWERLGVVATVGTTLAGTPWALQDQVILDGRGNTRDVFTKPSSINDISSICVGPGNQFVRGEEMVTINRVIGTGPVDNSTNPGFTQDPGSKQYRFILFTAQKNLCETTGTMDG